MSVFKTKQIFNYICIKAYISFYRCIHGWNIWNHVFMFLVMHTLCSWNEGSSHMMTRKTKVLIQHNDTCCLEGVTTEKGGINWLQVKSKCLSCSLSCIYFLKWRISSNTLCEKLKWQYNTRIHHAAKKDGIWWRRAESTSCAWYHIKSKCQDDQLLGLQIRNDSSPFSDSIAPFGFGGQPSMWTKEIGKCYHLWIMCCFFQDNGRQTVFVSYKQQCWSPFIDRYFASHSIFDWHILLQKYASVTSSICGKWSKIEAKWMLLCKQNMNS